MGTRLDRALAILLPQYSRSRLQQWLSKHHILINGHTASAKDKVVGNEKVVINATLASETQWQAQALPLSVVFEDEALLVINKPINLVVHPAVGHRQGTLVNALLHHHPALENIPRAGLIHRIDKDTSGLLVIAKTLEAHHNLSNQLKNRTMSRQYEAIVQGELTGGGSVDAAISRHPRQRIKMAVAEHGRTAITHYRISERLRHYTRLKISLETGRTHQIRVHMAHIRHPIVGDQTYGGRLKLPRNASETLINMLRNFKRQALHARWLTLEHPLNTQSLSFEAPLPDDITALLTCLRHETKMMEK